MERYRQANTLPNNQQAFLRSLTRRPEGGQFSGATADDLYDAVATLPDSDYVLITLQYLDGTSLKALSDDYGLSRKHLEMLLRMAADAIAGELESAPDEPSVTVATPAPVASPPLDVPLQVRPRLDYSATTRVAEEGEELLYTSENFATVAACRSNPDVFFSGTSADRAWAKRICGKCIVRAVCLEVALETDKKISPQERANSGIWAGLTAGERQKLVRRKP